MEDVIILRKLSVHDTEVLSTLANNRNIWNNMRDIFPHPYTIDDAKNFIAMVSKEDLQLTFGIDFNNQLVGVISFIKQPDVYRKSIEIGFWIGEEYWKKGITSTSIKKMIDYAENSLDVNRIFANVFEHNIASMKVLKNNGFIEEGISIDAVYKNNQFHNLHRFYLLVKNG
ncbi:GNAT family N-acetyltransferase [Chryseobacterium potabilaquae]|uniref:Ribosomal N-acetyltransferase YdaF n=1 Tax=Chryseobacterium potabilaquae TaxID=2675057 RepID=A0A6N4X318_9FLAO|nr:GNAT family N-acetyltransferase [Chryseobacterium potabilaquae]CAA7194796.1 Putative ribosomal N-acetyltransferase YdaF [Chryseobacterium potabilaquae]